MEANVKIYKITNLLNNKSYIGLTNNIIRRFEEHVSGGIKTYISKAINKYGKAVFNISVLTECKNYKEANELERYFIKSLDTLAPKGYNLTDGGEGHSLWLSQSRRKLSLSLTGRIRTKEHSANISKNLKERMRKGFVPFKDRKYTEISKEKNLLHQPNIKRVQCIDTGVIYHSLRDAALKTGINRESITLASQSKKDREGYLRKTAGGYKWKIL